MRMRRTCGSIVCAGALLLAACGEPAGPEVAAELEDSIDVAAGSGTMQAFEIADLIEKRRQSGDTWIEFLRVPALSMGVYVLDAGAKDLQTPHAEDEVYYVVSGRGVLQVDGRDQPVRAGSVVFVAGDAKHHFHSIEEELTTLVFFAPAEGSTAAAPAD